MRPIARLARFSIHSVGYLDQPVPYPFGGGASASLEQRAVHAPPGGSGFGHWIVFDSVPMNGFLKAYVDKVGANAPDTETLLQIMHTYTPVDLPVLNTLARQYAVSDEWFWSVPSQTNSNRACSLSGTSCGLVNNGYFTNWKDVSSRWMLTADPFDAKTLFNVLEDHGFHDWDIFWDDRYNAAVTSLPYTRVCFPHLEQIANIDAHFHRTSDPEAGLLARARNGTLKKFTYVEPAFATRTEAYDAVARYIDGFYNSTRRHSTLGYVIPSMYEQLGVHAA